jgi:hypothetical protein
VTTSSCCCILGWPRLPISDAAVAMAGPKNCKNVTTVHQMYYQWRTTSSGTSVNGTPLVIHNCGAHCICVSSNKLPVVHHPVAARVMYYHWLFSSAAQPCATGKMNWCAKGKLFYTSGLIDARPPLRGQGSLCLVTGSWVWCSSGNFMEYHGEDWE